MKMEKEIIMQWIQALESSNYKMTKRLKYTKDILIYMLDMNQKRIKQKDQNSNNEQDISLDL